MFFPFSGNVMAILLISVKWVFQMGCVAAWRGMARGVARGVARGMARGVARRGAWRMRGVAALYYVRAFARPPARRRWGGAPSHATVLA